MLSFPSPSNTKGFANTAVGIDALISNTMDNSNTATGESALSSNTVGGTNTAAGTEALKADHALGFVGTRRAMVDGGSYRHRIPGGGWCNEKASTP